ncbi:hypothetical protein ACF0H5_006160 [Mactra antiquata]
MRYCAKSCFISSFCESLRLKEKPMGLSFKDSYTSKRKRMKITSTPATAYGSEGFGWSSAGLSPVKPVQ